MLSAMANTNNSVLTTGSVASEVSLLFRTKRVSEIRAIESRIRADAEDKSESLRDLLGTRYKDLLSAADELETIRDTCSTSVCDALRDMAKSAAILRETFLSKSERGPAALQPVATDLERRRNVHVIGSKLKHIVDSPEMLYAFLERGEVYDAALRYALAASNYAELQQTAGLEGVASRFAEQRWKQVEVFRDQIVSMSEKKLLTYGLSTDAVARVLAALVSLAGKERDIIAVLNGMFASRTAWIDDQNRSSSGTVPARVQSIASIVKGTVSCMAGMFWSDSDACVERLLREVDPDAADELEGLRVSGALGTTCDNWISDVKSWLAESGKGILGGADTSRVLVDTLRAVEEVFADEGWPADCESVLGQPPKFVFDIFTPFISERAASVTKASVERAVDKVVSDVETAWMDLKVGSDVSKIVWSNMSSQVINYNTDHDNVGYKSLPTDEDAVMREVAFDSAVQSVVGVFETALLEALSDVTALTQRIPIAASAFDSAVRSSLPLVLSAMKKRLDSVPDLSSDASFASSDSCELLLEKSLFISRSAAALGSAACVKSAYQVGDGVVEADELGEGMEGKDSERAQNGFPQFRQAADELCMAGYQTWSNILCRDLKEQLRKGLELEESLLVSMGWAGDSTDSSVTQGQMEQASNLRYPTAASTAAVNFILRACSFVNRAGGIALPQEAVGFLRSEMRAAAVHAYKSAIKFYGELMSDTDRPIERRHTATFGSSDVAMMQMLFDVLVLQQLMGEPENIRMTNDKLTLQGTEQQLNAAIDPIDLASCKKSLNAAVSAYLSRTSVLFGAVTRSLSRPSLHMNPVSATAQLASSNFVSLAASVPRFTYLPAPMPSTYSSVATGTAGLSAKAALGALRSEATSLSAAANKKREADTSVAGYASKVSESVGRFGRGFFESFTRKVG